MFQSFGHNQPITNKIVIFVFLKYLLEELLMNTLLEENKQLRNHMKEKKGLKKMIV